MSLIFSLSIVPRFAQRMSKQMYRVYEKFLENENVGLLSHTIDPSYDTVAALANYARLLGVSSPKWEFVTGDKDQDLRYRRDQLYGGRQ